MSEKTFSMEIKEEIIKQKITSSLAINFINGFLYTQKDSKECLLTVHNSEIFDFIIHILQNQNIQFTNPKKNQIHFFANEEFLKKPFKKQSDFFGAIFLTTGSISDVDSTTYHLEIKFSDEQNAHEIRDIINGYGLDFKVLKRRNHYILYIKKVENICDFLKAIKAPQSYMKFEETKINRDFSNSINRLTNFDYYNQEKIAISNMKFFEEYDFILEHKLEHEFSAEQLLFFKIKRENPDLSLSELVEKLSKENLVRSKSTLNYYLSKLSKVYKKNQQ
ncbi:DNA-binding protein WhiA [[Mycoplasma] gypis]|uniref:Probable cell division protein WhiA n=1 Tax=[Mycoplasma] gypis TaxID=92404 RepID=A0ABZ2RP29_9BACT|nr:DNA-binding protein WhiA [[Mycoplasma] gypis]MBN0919334.1 DNA-binding protein WhiA [[Mycoplasma] gypis]